MNVYKITVNDNKLVCGVKSNEVIPIKNESDYFGLYHLNNNSHLDYYLIDIDFNFIPEHYINITGIYQEVKALHRNNILKSLNI